MFQQLVADHATTPITCRCLFVAEGSQKGQQAEIVWAQRTERYGQIMLDTRRGVIVLK